MLAHLEDDEESVILADQRIAFYAEPSVSLFSARAHLGSEGRVTEFEMLGREDLDIDMQTELSTMWRLLVGPD